jgi:hypothetical protein
MGKETKDMSHSITISGNTVEEFKAAFGQFARQFGYFSPADLQAAAQRAAAGKAQSDNEKPAEKQPEAQQPAEQPARRGRKPKAETQAQPEAEKQVDLEEAIAEKNSAALTVEDVKAAMRTVVGAPGLGTEACQALLAEYGAKRASDVPDDKRQAFIDACSKKVAGK